MKRKWFIFILLIVLIKEMNAQFIVPINVNKGISQNDIQVIHTPFDIGTIKNVFDNDVSSHLGIKETLQDDAVELFPNPASENIFITGVMRNSQISIFDLNNKLQIKRDLSNDSVLDISMLDAGAYIVFIKSQEAISIKKLIIL